MRTLYRGKYRLEETAVIKPFNVQNIAVQVIVQYFHDMTVLRIKYERVIITMGIMTHRLTDDFRQSFAPLTHVRRLRTEEIAYAAGKMKHNTKTIYAEDQKPPANYYSLSQHYLHRKIPTKAARHANPKERKETPLIRE